MDACSVECALMKMNAFVLSGLFHALSGEQRLIHPNFSIWELGGHAINLWGGQISVHITFRMCRWCDCTSSSLGR